MGKLATEETTPISADELPRLRVLVVEDDAGIGDAVAELLRDEGHEVSLVADGALALRALEMHIFDLVVTDVRLPGVDGMELFQWLRSNVPSTAVILMSAYGTVSEAVGAMRHSATHYLRKPFEPEHLLSAVREVALQCSLEQARRGSSAPESDDEPHRMVGECPAIENVRSRIAVVAPSDAPVLIRGESGTGKELVARSIHQQSGRADGPFVAINCAAFPDTLFEAELFGHERGAFTGADRRREGRFEAARGGTLLLDEVSEIPPTTQAKLLRVLESGTYQRLGSNEEHRVDVRILSATNADLRTRMREGSFREDLYYRLKVLEIRLPPLRERRGDLACLVAHFLSRYQQSDAPPPRFSPRAWAALRAHGYPGNVRELEHAVRHAVLMSAGREIGVSHLPDEIRGSSEEIMPASDPYGLLPLADAVAEFERGYIMRALAMVDCSRTKAAALLEISRKSLWEKIKRHRIDTSELERPSWVPPPPD